MTKTAKIIGLGILFFLMLAMTLYASSHQNLFTQFDFSSSPEWFQATLVDFYINQIIIWFWAQSLEKKIALKALWFIVFMCFGSMGTTLYLILRLIQNKSLFKQE